MLTLSVPAIAEQGDLYGVWTKTKNRCTEEDRIQISATKFSAYESSCKVRLLYTLPPFADDKYRFDLACSNEGEKSLETEFINVLDNNTLQVEYGSLINPTKLYRCKR